MEGRFFIRPLKQNRLTQVCLKMYGPPSDCKGKVD
jgi:hypothetical protein